MNHKPCRQSVNQPTKTAFILVAGDFCSDLCHEATQRHIQQHPLWQALPRPDLVIAADGGARHAQHLGLTLDVWVGDFDSSADLQLSDDIPKQVHPTAKNQTDAELAVQIACEKSVTHLVFIGAFGGRFDHAATLMLGAVELARKNGLRVCLCSGKEWGWPLLPEQPLALTPAIGDTLSVLAWSPLQELSIEGVRWSLQKRNIELGSGLTMSNEVIAPLVELSITAGYGLVYLNTLGCRSIR